MRKIALLSALLLIACSRERSIILPTPPQEVRNYRQQLNELVDEVNAVETAIRRQAVGSSGQATSANLAVACEQLCERLRFVLTDLELLTPPLFLEPLHADLITLVQMRLTAYEIIGANQTDSEILDAAETQLRQANDLAERINEELAAVDASFGSAKLSPEIAIHLWTVKQILADRTND